MASLYQRLEQLGSGATAAKAIRDTAGDPYGSRYSAGAPRNHWMGEAEVEWERRAEEVAYRREQDEMGDIRRDDPLPLFPDQAGREY